MKFFPFDHQRCDITLDLESKGNNSVFLKADDDFTEAVVYGGSLILQEFEITDIG